jgi:mannose-6-phosphate isomerase-like protein (cupin superfamily)
VRPQGDELTAGTAGASYKPLFGAGDREADQLKSVARYGELTLAPGASSAMVEYPREEQIYFVTEGSGTLRYGVEQSPIRKNDFAYLPVGVRHGISNSSTAPLRVIVMGYRIPAEIAPQPTPGLLVANADDVGLQVLGQHGPTTQFKLLMGLTSSKRDKLAAAYVMDSLFIMDFAPGGTNIPHHHPAEEEIYLLLRGSGEMVAGLDAAGREIRHPVTEGAVFFFKPGTQVGYYSGAREGQPHDLILAARSMTYRP